MPSMLRRPHLLLALLVLAGCAPGPTVLSVQVPGIGDPRSPGGYAGFPHAGYPHYRRHLYREFRHKRYHHHRPYRGYAPPHLPT